MADMKILPSIVFEDIKEETKDNPIWTQFEENAIRKVVNKALPFTLKKWLVESIKE